MSLTNRPAGPLDPAEAPTVPIPLAGASGPAPAPGRHRSPHRPARRKEGAAAKAAKNRAPVRTGLFGASAAVAMGAVAMVSGLLPGNPLGAGGDGSGGHGAGGSGQVRADAPLDAPLAPPDTAPAADARPGPAPVPRYSGPTAPVQRPESTSGGPAAGTGVPDGPAPAASAPAVPAVEQVSAPRQAAPAQQAAAPRRAARPPQGSAPLPAAAPRQPAQAPRPPAPGARPGRDARVPSVSGPSSRVRPRPGAQALVEMHATVTGQILSLVNAERAKAGCRPLRADHRLTSLAQSFSNDMARRGFFDHTDPDGRSPWDRAARHGVRNLGGENIARGHPDAHTVMEAWMRSAGHRQNILNCEYRTLGVGVRKGPGGPWWTQDFGY
ncbi:CAP domain-containing protein [Streptomyces orinoci]|uniref:CAP domain-containing protein n=1 Tax=Streptomyces orinoci TaxID=67339 RepID=A0ABV3K742_STRON|nr:CAP domain-containing protein [Streptomyces orinoci]